MHHVRSRAKAHVTKVECVNSLGSIRMFAIELRDQLRSMNIVLRCPGVLLIAVTLPQYQELQLPSIQPAVQYILHFVLCLVANYHWWRWWLRSSSRDWVVRCQK